MKVTTAALQRYRDTLKRQLHRVELPVLILIALVAVGVWVFAAVADAVLEGAWRAVDVAVIVAMRNPANLSDPIGPRWVEEMARDFTALGGVAVLLTLTLATVGYLILAERRRIAVFVLVAVCGGMVLSSLFKTAFDRPRPELVPHLSYVYSTSFPSGHSMMSAVTYLTLGTLLARIHKRRAVKIYFLGLATLLTLAIGISRVYLGVHWLTDVVAGWAAGATWAILCWLVALWLQQRRVVEPEADTTAAPQKT
ncbi:MAG TPA: phosphatase PAP2 family protein [Burkholderiales bacterium]